MNAKEKIEHALDELNHYIGYTSHHVSDLKNNNTMIALGVLRTLLQDHILIPKSEIPEGLEFAVKEIYPRQKDILREEIVVMMQAAQAIVKHSGGE